MLIKDISSDKRKCIENMEALLHKIELDASVLQMNGVERPLGRKWLEAVRELLVAATQCSEDDLDYLDDCIPRLELINDRIVNWRRHLQGPQRVPSPTVSIKDIVSDCADICHSYNYFVLGLKKNDEAKKCYSSEDTNKIKSVFRSLKNMINSKSMTALSNTKKSLESRIKSLSLRPKSDDYGRAEGKKEREREQVPIMSKMKEMFTLKTPGAIEARKVMERERRIKENEEFEDDNHEFNPLQSPYAEGEGEDDDGYEAMSESEYHHHVPIDPKLSLRRAHTQPRQQPSSAKASRKKSNRATMLTTRPPMPRRHSKNEPIDNDNFFSRFYKEPIKALNDYLPAFGGRGGYDSDGCGEGNGGEPMIQKNAYHLCAGCERAIIRGGIMTSNQDYYHEKCFKCVFCNMSLSPNSYREERGALMCRGQCRYVQGQKSKVR